MRVCFKSDQILVQVAQKGYEVKSLTVETFKTQLETVLNNCLSWSLLEQRFGLEDFQRTHPPSVTMQFCDSVILKHTCFYSRNHGLPFWCRSLFSLISAQYLLTGVCRWLCR